MFWKFEIPDEVIELAFCDLMFGAVCASLHLLKLLAAVLHCLKKHCLLRQSTYQNCPEVQEQEVDHHEAQAELLMVYSDTQVLIFPSWNYHFEYGTPYRNDSQYYDCYAPSKPWAIQTAFKVLFHSPTH